MQKSDADNLASYEEEKRPFDDVMRVLLQAKPKHKSSLKHPQPLKKARKPKTRKN